MLTFPIKKKWFDMIKSGEKKEEYRADSPYYDSRLLKYKDREVTVCFRNGYSTDSPKIYCDVIPHRQESGETYWGAIEGVEYWRLVILSVSETEARP